MASTYAYLKMSTLKVFLQLVLFQHKSYSFAFFFSFFLFFYLSFFLSVPVNGVLEKESLETSNEDYTCLPFITICESQRSLETLSEFALSTSFSHAKRKKKRIKNS